MRQVYNGPKLDPSEITNVVFSSLIFLLGLFWDFFVFVFVVLFCCYAPEHVDQQRGYCSETDEVALCCPTCWHLEYVLDEIIISILEALKDLPKSEEYLQQLMRC